MKTKSVIGSLFKAFLHLVFKVVMLALWGTVKLFLLILGRIQTGLETYLQKDLRR